MKYTKGDWKAQKPYIDKPFQVVTVDKNGRLKDKIADVIEEFDARLISAAPDLYEALKEAKRRIEFTSHRTDTQAVVVLGRIEQALAKAQGKD